MNDKLRIALLSEHASPAVLLGSEDAGGQNVYVDEISRSLGRLGYNVDIYTRRTSADVPEVIDWAPGIRLVNLRAGPTQFIAKDALWPLMPAFRDAFLDFIRREGTRYDLLHANFWMSGWVATELRCLLGIPAVQIFHAMGKMKRRHQGIEDTSPQDRIDIELAIVREVDALIAPCPSECTELIENYQASPDKVTVIPLGTNTETFRPVLRDEARRRIGLNTYDPVIVYVGRMLPRKDVRNLVHAVGMLAERGDAISGATRLLLVGGESEDLDSAITPEISVLQQLAESLNIANRVHFTGNKQPNVLGDYYSSGDVVVTTPWYEPFGLTPLEAMACGRPVVGSAIGGLAFTIEDGITGYLVPPRDPEALANRLHYLLTHPTLCIQMGYAARARVEQQFTWPIVAQSTAALYEKVARNVVMPLRKET